jgi:glycosyltransferase involved in cell wall biosynthesis
MKIIVAHNRYSSAQPSGENAAVDADIAALRDAGVSVVPFLRDSDSITSVSPALALSPVYARSAVRSLRALLRSDRPDLLHLHNPYPLLSPYVVRTARAAGVPVVQTVHNYRHACANGVLFRDGSPCTQCLGARVPLPAVRHGCYRGSRAQSLAMATALAAHRRTWDLVDLFLAPSSAIATFLTTFGIEPERVLVKPNAVADPGPPAPLGDGFLFAGRAAPEKGLDLLMAAFACHSPGSLGPLRVASSSVPCGRSDVDFLGPLTQSGVRAAIRRSAVVVVPSRWPEVLPTIAIEALAAGRPVLGTAVGGIGDVVGDAGWIVPPAVDTLADALPLALAAAPALSIRARERYLTHYHPDVVTPQLLAAYRRVLSHP